MLRAPASAAGVAGIGAGVVQEIERVLSGRHGGRPRCGRDGQREAQGHAGVWGSLHERCQLPPHPTRLHSSPAHAIHYRTYTQSLTGTRVLLRSVQYCTAFPSTSQAQRQCAGTPALKTGTRPLQSLRLNHHFFCYFFFFFFLAGESGSLPLLVLPASSPMGSRPYLGIKSVHAPQPPGGLPGLPLVLSSDGLPATCSPRSSQGILFPPAAPGAPAASGASPADRGPERRESRPWRAARGVEGWPSGC